MTEINSAAESVTPRKPPQLIDLPIRQLVPNPRNPNKHPDEQIDRLMASLEHDGQTRPVLARSENNMIIAGHGVTLAALRLGWPKIRVMLWDVDQATADRVMLGDNRFGELSQRDDELVAELLREVGASDWMATGYTPEEVDKLLEPPAEKELRVFEIDTDQVTDDFWISVRGPLPDQAEVLQKLKQLLDDYPQVSVELGTIAEEDVAA